MPASSLIAALLRGTRTGNCGAHTRLALFSSLGENLRPFSSASSMSPDLAVQEEPAAAPEDDLKSRIFRLRLGKHSATAALEKWVSERRTVTAPELRRIAKELRRSQRYKHALEISEWMKTHHESDLSEHDYELRIDLITKVFGPNAAQDFFEGLPSAVKSCKVYTALLHSLAGAKLMEKAEDVFERMKKANFCIDVIAYNEMMTLYISVGQLDKVPLVVEELKTQKVSPDLFTYNLRVSASAATLDIEGARRILNEMADDPNTDKCWRTYIKLADIYVTAGHLISSENSLIETDIKISAGQWITYDFLIILYASLGNSERVRGIWKSMLMTLQKMNSRSYICVLSSHLVLGRLRDAGEVVDQWRQSKDPEFDISACNRLFNAFVKVGMRDAADSFRELMLQKGCILADSSCV